MSSNPSDSLNLSALHPSSGDDFDELLSIYVEGFSPAERKPVSALRGMLANPAYRVLGASRSGRCVGFSIVALLAATNAALLEYMAVRSDMRGQGLGRWLFRETAGAVIAEGHNTLLIEVESDHQPGPEQENQSRRKRFYRSLGARELKDLTWIMPPVAAALPPPMEMLLHGPHGHTVPKRELEHWMARIYVDVYGQTQDDPRLLAMAEALPAQVILF